MTTITRIQAREVLDSRGRPTVEAEVACAGGRPCRAIAPSEAYQFSATGGARWSADELIESLAEWVEQHPILSIEDGLAEEDWAGWKSLTARFGDRVQLIGDDLFATNPARLRRGIAAGVGNSVLIKLNQIGTLTETLDTMRLALTAGYTPVVSARSGETEDVTIADLAVATGAGQIKIGSVARSERLVKYNQLLRWAEVYPQTYVGAMPLRSKMDRRQAPD